MMVRISIVLMAGVLILCQPAPVASAEPQQPVDTSHAEWVYVTTLNSREEIKGRLLTLSPETLALLVDGQRSELPLKGIARIQKRGDSLKNGALIGAIVVGAWCAAICGQGLDSSSAYVPVVAANAGLGALIGMGIDALHKGRTTIYPARDRVLRP